MSNDHTNGWRRGVTAGALQAVMAVAVVLASAVMGMEQPHPDAPAPGWYAWAQASPAPDLSPAGQITDTDSLGLSGASGIATFQTGGGHTYATVAAYYGNSDPPTYLWTHNRPVPDTPPATPATPPASFTAPRVGANATFTTDPPAADPRGIGIVVLSSSSTQPGTIRASWTAPSETPTDYRISWAKEGEPFPTWTDSSGNAFPTGPSHTITGLEEGETYKVKVRARYSGDAPGDWSSETTATVPGVPDPRQNTVVLRPTGTPGPRDVGTITLASLQPGTIEASWVGPAHTPADYRIAWAKSGEAFKTWTDPSGNAFPTAPSYDITGLEGGEQYRVKVRASYAGTAGGWSGELAITVR